MNDDLSSLLQAWRHQPGHDPDFKAGVQARIDQAVPVAIVRPFTWALPLAAGLAVLLSVTAGVGTAVAINRAQVADHMAAAYARTIDPILMAGHEPHP